MFVTKEHNIVNYMLGSADTIQMENRAAELEKGSNIQVVASGKNFLHPQLM